LASLVGPLPGCPCCCLRHVCCVSVFGDVLSGVCVYRVRTAQADNTAVSSFLRRSVIQQSRRTCRERRYRVEQGTEPWESLGERESPGRGARGRGRTRGEPQRNLARVARPSIGTLRNLARTWRAIGPAETAQFARKKDGVCRSLALFSVSFMIAMTSCEEDAVERQDCTVSVQGSQAGVMSMYCSRDVGSQSRAATVCGICSCPDRRAGEPDAQTGVL
jgi:hypothetical protein